MMLFCCCCCCRRWRCYGECGRRCERRGKLLLLLLFCSYTCATTDRLKRAIWVRIWFWSHTHTHTHKTHTNIFSIPFLQYQQIFMAWRSLNFGFCEFVSHLCPNLTKFALTQDSQLLQFSIFQTFWVTSINFCTNLF